VRAFHAKQVVVVGGNKTLPARVLGLDRKTLHRKLERWSTPSSEASPSGV
jgi:two-component system response regulator HydG